MPSTLRDRIRQLMDEQADEASAPVSYAVLQSDDVQEQPESPPESAEPPNEPEHAPAAESPPVEPVEAPEAKQEQPPELEDVPEPETDEEVEMADVPPPEDVAAPEDWEHPEPLEQSAGDVPELSVPEGEGEHQQPEEPDWQTMLGYVGQQANDQLFDGIAIRLAESTNRIINRTQDRFEQHMAELDIGNSY